MGLTVARALLAAGLALLAGCGGCPKIRQEVFVGAPDPQLQTLIDACNAHVPTPDDHCPTMRPSSSPQPSSPPSIPCGCRALCERVLAIIDQFEGAENLESCAVAGSADGGVSVAVAVTYRPSTCP